MEGHRFAKNWIDKEEYDAQNDRASLESPTAPEGGGYEGMRAWEKLQTSLVQFAGADGFTALLRRALALACTDVPALKSVTITTGARMKSLEDIAVDAGKAGTEAVRAITARLLGLLASFVGEPLTVQLMREGWPDVSRDK